MLESILTLYSLSAVFNSLLMVFLHFAHNRQGYYLKAFLVWSGLFISLTMDGIVSQKLGLPCDLFGMIFISITTFGYVALGRDLYGIDIKLQKYFYALIAFWLSGVVGYFVFDLPFVITSSLTIVGVTLPTYEFFKKIYPMRHELNILDKWLVIIILINTAHLLDYPFVRLEPWAAIPGFSFAMILMYQGTFLIPVVINQKINKDHQRDLIQAKNESEIANRGKSIFLANISHEIRTPMHGILSFAQIAQERLGKDSNEQINEYMDDILQSGSRLMSLLNDLLDLAKAESGQMIFNFTTSDLKVQVDASASVFSRMAIQKNIKIVNKVDGLTMTKLDPDRIVQVMNNLLSNATKFSHEGGEILIESWSDEGYIYVSVENDGARIPKEERESIFSPFVQSSLTRKKSGGTGLGLSLCRQIIAAHKGTIWLDEGEKAKFVFKIPRNQQLEESDHAAS